MMELRWSLERKRNPLCEKETTTDGLQGQNLLPRLGQSDLREPLDYVVEHGIVHHIADFGFISFGASASLASPESDALKLILSGFTCAGCPMKTRTVSSNSGVETDVADSTSLSTWTLS